MTKRFNKFLKRYGIPVALGMATAPLSINQLKNRDVKDKEENKQVQTASITPAFDAEIKQNIEKPVLVKPKIKQQVQDLKTADLKAEPKIQRPVQDIMTADIKAEPKSKTLSDNSRELFIKDVMTYIAPTELKGDINKSEDLVTLLKRDPSVLKPYLDHKKLWTIGIGHLIGDGSNQALVEYKRERSSKGLPLAISIQEAVDLYGVDMRKKVGFVERYFGDLWNRMPDNVKKVIVDAHFRGDLINEKNPSKPFKWIELIKQGRYGEAGKEYIDHAEYRKTLKGEGRGVAIRMNRNKALLDLEAKKQQDSNLQ
jgi:hypothetical protein